MNTRRFSAALAVALAVTLTACGEDDDPTVSASAPATTSPTASASPPQCPLLPVEVPAPDGATTDLAVKPTIAPSSEPPPSEVEVADIVEGDGDEAVTGSQVEVKYVGAFYDTGEEFDSSWSLGPDETLPFGVCQQGVIPGFAIGPIGMKEGGRRQITIPSDYGYGPEGSGPIPPDSTLVFVVDLVEVS